MNVIHIFRYCLLLTLLCLANACLAGIQVGATRVIYSAADREASVQVRNEGAQDTMIQSWIEAAPGQAESDVPFAITPSLARLSHKKQQALRIFYQGKGLPIDRESVFWLSIQEIPQVSDTNNSLQIAFRQRMKLFYRPAELPGTADEAAKGIHWNILNVSGTRMLIANNTAAFYVSFAGVKVVVDGKEYPVEAEMLTPNSITKMALKNVAVKSGASIQVHWETINDYGAVIKHSSVVTP